MEGLTKTQKDQKNFEGLSRAQKNSDGFRRFLQIYKDSAIAS